jgi:glycerol kinase
VLVESGDDCSLPPHGLVRTACAVDGYALEGSVFVATAALEWLRSVASLDSFESEGDSTEGVYFVPALTGLGSPHWQPDARGLLSGLSQRTTRAHLLRATLEAIAFQIADVVDALPERPDSIGVDGGASANGFLMQFLADVLRLPVVVPAEREMTALGAAALAARARPTPKAAARYEPERDVSGLVAGWRGALSAVLA